MREGASRNRTIVLLVAVAWAVGLALRVHAARALPRPLYGDEPWYAGSAEALVGGAAHGFDPFIRPPGTTWWIAAVFALTGIGNLAAVGIANALLTSISVPILASIGRRAAPHVRVLPAVVAWAQALNPFDIVHSGVVESEALYVPLTLALVLLCLRAAETPNWRRAAAAGVCAAALLHVRTDVFPCVLAALTFGAVLARRAGASWRTSLARFGAATALAVLLCVPWSVDASVSRGRPVFVADQTSNPWFVERRGWWTWVSHVSMDRAAWLQVFWRGPAHVSREMLPEHPFASADEETQVLALLARAHAAGHNAPDVDVEFRRLGEERIAREPLRFHVLLPLERAGRMWLDPTESDLPPLEGAAAAGWKQSVLRAWRIVARLALGAGFLVSLVSFFRATPSGLAAFLVALRTLVLVALFPLFGHGAKFESRNLANVEPLAFVVLASAKFRRSRRTPSG